MLAKLLHLSHFSKSKTDEVTVVPLRSRHRPRRRRVRDGDFPFENRKQQPLCRVDDCPGRGAGAVMPRGCQGTRSRGSPSDRRGIRLSGSSHQMVCYGQPEADPQSRVLSVPTRLGKRGPPRYPHGTDHEPEYTSNYNSWARAG